MKKRHRIQRTVSAPALVAAGGVLVMLGGAGGVGAQESQPSLWVEPRVSVGVTLSDNAGSAQGEQLLEVSPGLRVFSNSPRVTGFLDYALSGMFYGQDTSANRLRHALNASATVQAWDNRAFVDLSGVVSEEAISAFGAQPSAVSSDTNRSLTANFRFSPYIRGSLAGVADYSVRYSLQSSSTEATSRSDVTIHDLSLALGGRGAGQVLGWSFSAGHRDTDYSLGQRIKTDSVRGGLVYYATPQLNLSLFAGVESTDALTPEGESYSNHGVSVAWRPSPRTRVSVGVDQRYFGTGHNILIEHRTSRTVWRYADVRGASNDLAGSATASLGSLYDLLNSLFLTDFPDDAQRAEAVTRYLEVLGLQANTEVFDSFLTSTATLSRTQQLSVALLGVRGVLTFALSQGSSSLINRATSLSGLLDDFSANTRVQQRGWNLAYAHRLTPITSVNASISVQKSVGTNGTAPASSKALAVGVSTRLGLRTTGSVQLRRSVNDGSSSPAGETSIAGLITHRF